MATNNENDKEKVSRETLGKYFYDLSKTCFASFVVANIIAVFATDNIITPILLALFGVVTTVVLARMGYNILKK